MRSHRDVLAKRLKDLLNVGSQKNLNAKLAQEIRVFNDLSAITNNHLVRRRRNHSSDTRYDADD